MRTKKKIPPLRCRCCRKWFRPESSAEHQRTCSLECRRKRRSRVAKRRRERDLESHRERERLRQHRCREKRSAEGRGHTAPLSRASLLAQPLALDVVIVQTVDKHLAVSRATLLAEIRAVLAEFGVLPGQAVTEKGHCHAPAPNS